MGIVSSRIVEDTTAGHGRRSITYGFTDQNGLETISHRRMVGAGFNAAAGLAAEEIRFAESLAGQETGIVVESVLALGDPVGRIFEAPDGYAVHVHTGARRCFRRLVRLVMQSRDPYLLLLIEPLMVYMDATFAVPVVKTWVNFTPGQYSRFRARLANAVADKANLLELDAPEDNE